MSYVYIPRRGNIVSSLFIWSRRLAMPQFHGRKATSLTSFLFLYTLLIVKVRRLAWRERNMLFAMDGDNRRINNDEKNIFYKYFSRLQLKEDIDITELDKKIKEFHNETLKTFATIIESSDKYENNNESFNRNILNTIVDEYHKFHKNTFENNLSQRFLVDDKN